jgi:hypothetical protein
MGIAHDYSLNSLVRQTQEKWLQQNKERWQFEPREEHRFHYIFPFLKSLGCIDAFYAQEKQYDYAVVLGGYYTRIQARLNHLIEEWDRGVRFRYLVFLTGERFLDIETEMPQFNLKSDDKTEAALMQHIWEAQFPHHPLKDLPFTLVDTLGRKEAKGWRRPSTKDTLLKWLSFSPKPGSCLFVSSQPFITYQHTVIQTHLPSSFSAETVGSYTEKHLALSVYLDNLSRWLYQEKQKGNLK